MKIRINGFTLLEVVVALAVAGIGLAGVIKIAGGNAFNAQHLQNRTIAQWVALNRVAELRSRNEFPPIGQQKGDAEMAGRKWYWQQESRASAFAVQAMKQSLREIEINVYTDEAHKTGSLATVSTYLAQP